MKDLKDFRSPEVGISAYMCDLNVKNINLIGLFSTFTFIITLETQVEVSLL